MTVDARQAGLGNLLIANLLKLFTHNSLLFTPNVLKKQTPINQKSLGHLQLSVASDSCSWLSEALNLYLHVHVVSCCHVVG